MVINNSKEDSQNLLAEAVSCCEHPRVTDEAGSALVALAFELEPADVEFIANLKGVCGEAPVPDEIRF